MKTYLFYLNLVSDNNGRKIKDYINADDQWWEHTHDFIQWAFPNKHPSMFNRNAPLLTPVLKLFLRNPISRYYHKLLLERADQFFDFKNPDWLNRVNGHNLLRISRVIHFCKATNHEFPNRYYFMQTARMAKKLGLLPGNTYYYWLDIS